MALRTASYRRRYRSRRSSGGPAPVLAVILCVLCLLVAGVFLYQKITDKTPGKDTQTSGTSADQTQTDVSGEAENTTPPEETSGGIPAGYVQISDADIHTGDLILVSKAAPFVFPENHQLVTVMEKKSAGSYYVRDYSILLTPVTMDALDRLLVAFYEHHGTRIINVVAGHRTEEFQQHLFDQSAERNGLEHAQRYVAQPGESEHHTGMALDLSLYFSDGTSADFIGTGEYQYIDDHAADYGFILRYPAEKEHITGIGYESWHYRYVGYPHAKIIAEKDFCLEEYLEDLRQYSVDAPLSVSYDGQAYDIYYCAEDALFVPAEGTYTVSGNNMDGFIVTVTR